MAIIKFGTDSAPNSEPITEDLDWWHPVEGSPTMKTWVEHSAQDGKLLAGYWEATPGTYRVKYDVDEYIKLHAGKVTLTNDGDEPQTFSAGDTLFIEAGFDGLWKTEETVRKSFVISAP